MKALTILITALGISMASALAQAPPSQRNRPASLAEPAPDQQADLLTDLSEFPLEKVERLVSFQNRTLQTVLGMQLQYTGVLPALKRAEQPWQLLNPFAPASYGYGYDTLTFSPGPERAPGFIVFAIRF